MEFTTLLMTPSKLIIFTTCMLLLTAYKPYTNPLYVTGHLRKGDIEYNDTSGVSVFVMGDGKLLAKTLSDTFGNFSFYFLPHNEKSFDFFCTGVGLDTLLIASYATFESDDLEDTFFVPAIVKKNSIGETICPKCGKADGVYKIVHSLAPIVTRKIEKNGDTTYSPIFKHTYQDDCINGGAKFYCGRDKIKF